MVADAVAPVRPRRIFYGWYVIGVTMIGGFLAAGASQLFMGLMLKPMTEDFGWSRTAAAGAITLGTFGAGLLSFPVGWLVDHYGPRLLAPIGGLIVAGAFFLLASLDSLWQFYAGYFIARGVAASTMSGVVSMTTATNWFRRRRGRALGLVAMGVPLGGAILAIAGQAILELSGWRAVFFTFGVLVLVFYVGPAALVIRRRPEDMGLLPDGDSAVTDSGAQPSRQPEISWTLGEAMRTRALWFIIFGVGVSVMANAAVGFHQVAYYTDNGISATEAAAVISVYAFSGAVANGLWGLLVEHFSERPLVVLVTMLSAGSVAFLLLVDTFPEALVFAVLFGLTARGEASLVMMLLAQYYGRDSYGTINGFVTPFQMAGLGLGPLLASASYDLMGYYTVAFLLFALSFFIAALLFWLATPPVRRELASAAALEATPA